MNRFQALDGAAPAFGRALTPTFPTLPHKLHFWDVRPKNAGLLPDQSSFLPKQMVIILELFMYENSSYGVSLLLREVSLHRKATFNAFLARNKP